jgi:hypothetical protein
MPAMASTRKTRHRSNQARQWQGQRELAELARYHNGKCVPRSAGVVVDVAMRRWTPQNRCSLGNRYSPPAVNAGWRSVQVQREGVLRSGQIAALQSLSTLADRLREWLVGICKALELAQQRIGLLCTGQVTGIERAYQRDE